MKTSKFGRRVRLAVAPSVTAAVALTAASTAFAQDAMEAPKKTDMEAAVQSTIFSNDPVSKLYDDVQKWKKDNGVPVEIGAYHWWHSNRLSPHDFMYGQRGLEGTYYWYAKFDPTFNIGDNAKAGAHVDARARDGEESFRPFFESNAWLWEAYGWVEVCETKYKAGKIWRRFGLDWDGSFYGNVAYFDGWKLDPDYGASIERTCDFGKGITAPSFIQVFFADDEVNGSISGADAESDDHATEKESIVLRTVPTWTNEKAGSVAVGLSWQAGQIEAHDRRDHTATAGAVDVTWTKGPVKAFAEWMQSVGERNSTNYVTGGPSSRSTVWEAGGAYTWKFATLRGTVSHGGYDDPGGSQALYLLGVDLAVTKNVILTVEYVRWDTKQQNGAPRAFFEDGFSFVINWHF
jgi:hypothetical protein